MSKAPHDVRFPNESEAYRDARNDLLEAEVALRRQTEAVAAMRRGLPLGGAIREDYAFTEITESGRRSTPLSSLFGSKNTLVIYSFMYGPAMENACPSCTSILDSLDGASDHINQRVALAVVAKSPIERVMDYARGRGWSHLRLLSSEGTTYNADYRGEAPEGYQLPSLNVFVRDGSTVRHFYNTELLFVPSDPGQHPRHADSMWPVWAVLDMTPGGRPDDWEPQRSYAA